MTRGEAIEWLTDIKCVTENWAQEVAIDMAIEALSSVETKGDLISKEDAIEAVVCHIWHTPNEAYKLFNCENIVREVVEDVIERLPFTDRPIGHIVIKSSGKFNPTIWAECSECGKPIDAWDKFCRHCGAKMEGGEDK